MSANNDEILPVYGPEVPDLDTCWAGTKWSPLPLNTGMDDDRDDCDHDPSDFLDDPAATLRDGVTFTPSDDAPDGDAYPTP